MRCYLIIFFICIFLKTSDTEHIFMCLLTICISSAYFFYWVFFFFLLLVSCINYLHILDINTLSIASFANIFSRKLLFHSVDGFLCCPKDFKID